MRIAFADDHALVREGLRPFLKSFANSVDLLEADSFGGLIRGLEESGGADLCVLDLRMPDMDPMTGIVAVTRAFPDIKVVVLSSVTDPRIVKEALAKGVRGYIPKRMTAEAIVSALHLVMAGETFLPSLVLGNAPPAYFGEGELTAREREIMALLREGTSNKGIARKLNISEVTVKTHLTNAFRKMNVQNRVQAAKKTYEYE